MQESKLHLEDVPQLLVTLLEKIEKLEIVVQALGQKAINTIATNELMTIKEAGQFLHLTENTLYKKVSRSEIPNSKQGKKLYFRKSELEDWLASGRRKTNAELSAIANEHLAIKYGAGKKTRNND